MQKPPKSCRFSRWRSNTPGLSEMWHIILVHTMMVLKVIGISHMATLIIRDSWENAHLSRLFLAVTRREMVGLSTHKDDEHLHRDQAEKRLVFRYNSASSVDCLHVHQCLYLPATQSTTEGWCKNLQNLGVFSHRYPRAFKNIQDFSRTLMVEKCTKTGQTWADPISQGGATKSEKSKFFDQTSLGILIYASKT